MKNPLTPAGIEPATYRFVAQHLNHSARSPVDMTLCRLIQNQAWQTLRKNLLILSAAKIAEDGRYFINVHQNTRRHIPKPADYLCFIVITFAAFKCLALSCTSLDLFVCYIITIDVFMFPATNEVVCVSEYPTHPIPNSGSL